MKSLSKIKKLSKKSFLIPLFIIFSLPSIIIGQEKPTPFTSDSIIEFLKKPNPNAKTITKKNEVLIDLIPKRKVVFDVTPEIESQLRKAGANNRLIKTIKNKNNKIKSPTTMNREISNSFGMEFILIPAGSFTMGSPTTETNRQSDETPHRVTISKSFYMGKYEVTQEQWEKVMDSKPSHFKDCPRCPVESISWKAVQDFIEKLNRQGEGKYRLPTEDEWEYACRAGSTTKYSFGDDEALLDKYAWYGGNAGGKTHEVGTRDSNAWGLYDMHGNVYEWCENLFGDYLSGRVTELRANRGGSWTDGTNLLRSADRSHDYPGDSNNRLGFRLVREL